MLTEELAHLYLCLSFSLGVAVCWAAAKHIRAHLSTHAHQCSQLFLTIFWRALIAAIVHLLWQFSSQYPSLTAFQETKQTIMLFFFPQSLKHIFTNLTVLFGYTWYSWWGVVLLFCVVYSWGVLKSIHSTQIYTVHFVLCRFRIINALIVSIMGMPNR